MWHAAERVFAMSNDAGNPFARVSAGDGAEVVREGELESLADRLREVRRQLTRGRRLAGAIDRRHASPTALRAAERLESAVQRLDEGSPPARRLRGLNDSPELPWLVRVVERRAKLLANALEDAH